VNIKVDLWHAHKNILRSSFNHSPGACDSNNFGRFSPHFGTFWVRAYSSNA
jgi:hypothetical protein